MNVDPQPRTRFRTPKGVVMSLDLTTEEFTKLQMAAEISRMSVRDFIMTSAIERVG